MDVDAFWTLIETSARETTAKEERATWLEDRLAALTPEEIADFASWWTLAANRACSWDMWATARKIMHTGSPDGFEYFVSWLIGLGRDAFESVADHPDAVVDLPEVRRLLTLTRSFFRIRRRTSRSGDGRFRLTSVTKTDGFPWTDEDWPVFEALQYAPHAAYQRVTGPDADDLFDALDHRGVRSRFPLMWTTETRHPGQPHGDDWDFDDEAEFARRLPRTAHYYATSY
uniref:DUF4240 domain-containing protein n=1 Tax=Herbidospora sakaeratensis TaxID=564415 RepID=UPI000784A829|nr:DUF4240 domain-containing protein [Herbidospora sakaeratensis]